MMPDEDNIPLNKQQPLPIDPLVPSVVAALAQAGTAVLIAPPGAGKTTRVPPAVLDALPKGEVLVLQPRRIAAHLSASRVADERGLTLGKEVGVQMRFESLCEAGTRLRYVTEGVLLRRLCGEPELPGVSCVILDEFHERHLHVDLALALLCRLRRGTRKDLQILVMSATLDGAQVVRYLEETQTSEGPCPLLSSQGALYEVAIHHLQEASTRPLHKEVAGALLRLLQMEAQSNAPGGDILVFLPGAGEIRRAQEELGQLVTERRLALWVVALHGDMPLSDQRKVLSPKMPGDPRTVILCTNVAETSLTIPSVTVVIDSGLARIAGHSPWSGLSTLKVQKVARAAAIQRAGRAGRVRAGVCLRLYTKADFDGRPEFETPEIRRLDLAEAVLLLRRSGIDPRDPSSGLHFLEPPKEAALASADALLLRLGALGPAPAEPSSFLVTRLGDQMAQLPLHPRQAAMVLYGAERGYGQEACCLAALLGERDLRLGQRQSFGGPGMLGGYGYGGVGGAQETGPSDLLQLFELFEEAKEARFDRGRLYSLGIDPAAAQAVERTRSKVAGLVDRLLGTRTKARTRCSANEEAVDLLQVILRGYPDRVAKRRSKRGEDLVLCGGGAVVLSPKSVVREAETVEYVAVLDAEERGDKIGGREPLARLVSAIEPDWLLDLPSAPLSETSQPLWNESQRRVEVVRRLCYENLVLSESRDRGDPLDPTHVEVLVAAAKKAGLVAIFGEKTAAQIDRLLVRAAFVQASSGKGPLSKAEIVAQVIASLAQNKTSFAELEGEPVVLSVLSACGLGSMAQLDQVAPEAVELPSGRRATVEYEDHKPPYIASRMQDFFGLPKGPCLGQAPNQVPLVLHLLSPNGRPVQVTTDLAGFWSRHYPAIRKELCRRYPRHYWPEDPLHAEPRLKSPGPKGATSPTRTKS